MKPEEPGKTAEAPPQPPAEAKNAPTATPQQEAPKTEAGKAETPAAAPAAEPEQAKAAKATKPAEPGKAAEASAQPLAPAASPPAAAAETKKLAEVEAQLAATQAEVQLLGQKLQQVTGQLTAQLAASTEKMKAQLAAREAPSKAGEASARIVVAQSLLTALRRGENYATQLQALQNFGADPANVARLRAGLTAPNERRLAAAFEELSPQILASVAPEKTSPQADQAKKRSLGHELLAYVESRARRLVRVRRVGAPEGDVTAIRVARMRRDLSRRDLAAALAQRARLPAPARAVSADWAKSAQARLDAEEAAKAELAAAMRALSKSKT